LFQGSLDNTSLELRLVGAQTLLVPEGHWVASKAAAAAWQVPSPLLQFGGTCTTAAKALVVAALFICSSKHSEWMV
jgi:hypothetical protein